MLPHSGSLARVTGDERELSSHENQQLPPSAGKVPHSSHPTLSPFRSTRMLRNG
jgi:hypothetical protein